METPKKCLVFNLAMIIVLCFFHGCTIEPYTLNDWKPWVLSRADVEDYSAINMVSQYIDERSEKVVFRNYDEKYIQWWRDWWDEKTGGYYQDSYDDKELKDKFVELQACYSVLAELTFTNALITSDENEDPVEELGKAFLRMMGNEYVLLAYFEELQDKMDLNNLKTLSRLRLKESMNEVIGDPKGFSLFKSALKIMDDDWDFGWWDPDVVTLMSLNFREEFFENVMLILGDFSELKQRIDETVSVYSCEYNSSLSSKNSDVYDVIYSIKDKMFVRCTILESNGRAEIQINNQSTSLLSL